MERAYLWFKCAAVHDPVRPVIKKPAVLGWKAKERRVDLVIERPFNGDELLRRMKGWVTTDVYKVIDLIDRFGKLKLLDDADLVVEIKDLETAQTLSEKLAENFGQEVWLESIVKDRLK